MLSRLAALVIAAVLPTAAIIGVPVSGSTAYAATCSSSTGVTVVVDYHDLGGGVRTVCEASGGGEHASELFPQAGFPLTYAQRQPGYVCRVTGVPTSDPCVNTSPADAYWGLWWSDGDAGSRWTYSSLGVGSLSIPDGGLVAFSWDDVSGDQPPAASAQRPGATAPSPSPTAAQPHPTTTPTPTPTHATPSHAAPTATPEPVQPAVPSATVVPPPPATASPTASASASATAKPSGRPSPRPSPSRTAPAAAGGSLTSSPSESSAPGQTELTQVARTTVADQGGLPTWVVLLVLLVLVAGAAAAFVVRRRRLP